MHVLLKITIVVNWDLLELSEFSIFYENEINQIFL